MSKTNLFCRLDDLINEADVEQIFARRLIEHIGYADRQIRPKDALTELAVGEMQGTEALYRPDFAVKIRNQVRWILEAKSPNENLDRHVKQPREYCRLINGQYRTENPVHYFVLSNGLKTRLYQWDVNDPILELDFEEIGDSHKKFGRFVSALSPNRFSISGTDDSIPHTDIHRLEKRSLEDVNAAFAWCHQEIYKKDNINQAAAFTEFVKVVFLKLLSDRKIRDQYPNLVIEESVEVPAERVDFSTKWIASQERHTPNPLDTIQFHAFIQTMEREIGTGKRRRVFDANEKIDLTPETIRSVVKKIENIYLFGIDADLNGRLFETFLSATMRGRDLGQYFTPRSIAKLGAKLAMIKVHAPLPNGSWHTDIVLDGCCGTGGFLIEALSVMWHHIDKNHSLTADQKDARRAQIANEHIYGVDIGREPPLARIARLNMYLHGDGGSNIFSTDILDKKIQQGETDSVEIIGEKEKLRDLFVKRGFADVVLTNPPFAKQYERKTEREAVILDDYEIAKNEGGSKRPSLKSNLMFIERYHDLLKVEGRLVTVIDDGILSGQNYKWFRDFIRQKFIIKAVISLPGDAFQRSKARVKTSLIILEKRDPNVKQVQPSVFMYGCQYVGIDDPSRQRTLPIDKVNRVEATKEIRRVVAEYTDFLAGNGNPEYIVPTDEVTDRLDVKSCLMRVGRKVDAWRNRGIGVDKLSDLVTLKQFGEEDVIVTSDRDDFVTYLRVRYDGFAEAGDDIIASDTQYTRLFRIREGDIVISNIAASYGSVAVVPKELDRCVVTTEYTVLRAKENISPLVIWMLLRSPEIRADMLLLATGANRTRVSWETMKNLNLPRPALENAEAVAQILKEAERAERHALNLREQGKKMLESSLELDNEESQAILRAFKPPR